MGFGVLCGSGVEMGALFFYIVVLVFILFVCSSVKNFMICSI